MTRNAKRGRAQASQKQKLSRVPPRHRPYSGGVLYHPSSTQYSWRGHKGRYVEMLAPHELSFGAWLARNNGPIDWSKHGKLRL